MNFSFLFGNYDEQISSIKNRDRDLFVRKVIFLSLFAKELNKKGLNLFIEIKEEYRKASFCFESLEPKKPPINNLYELIINPNLYGLDGNFFQKYSDGLSIAIELEDLMTYDNLRNKLSPIYPLKIEIIDNSFDWVKVVFCAIDKEEIYPYFMSVVLEKNLKQNDKCFEKTKKI